ncbi:unnamed protein product [Fraxinus pennsylvanica]|uniref:Alpha/beta hydrolase fold-3 domain-containing protein n=1 Tax=Fraxinus pennsylvanica TaxID=56036 RepID=A0AAD2EA13_9LAMI|nr:unnamed protein product [Fraxinus pennsylvanica]
MVSTLLAYWIPNAGQLIFVLFGRSPANPPFHNFVSSLVEKANVIAISVDYRLALENPLPIAFDDSWEAFQWLISHVNGKGSDQWINEYAYFGRVFLGGESAGANIANDVAIGAGENKLQGAEIVVLFLIHPFFGGKEEDKLYKKEPSCERDTNRKLLRDYSHQVKVSF